MKRVYFTLIMIGLLMFNLDKPMAQVYESCDQWASWTGEGYTIWNNGWGSNFQEQCLWVNSASNWGVVSTQPGGGINSYPNIDKSVSYFVDEMPDITSSFSVSVPSSGNFNTAYDIWYNNYAYEIMLWMNWTGEMGPISYDYSCNGACPIASNVSIGGHTWNVYNGNNGSNEVFSFLRTSSTNSGTVNITAISQWLRSNGYFGNVHLHNIQFGWEINLANNGAFTVNNYNVTIGSSSCTPTTIVPYIQVNGGTWQQTSSVSVNSGDEVKFGPQPTSGGSWSWSGCGTSGTSREQTVYPTSTCTAMASYTNSCGAQSTQNFTVNVSGGSSGSGNITVRARGTQGDENIELRVNNSTVANWTLSTSYQDYSASGSGDVSVYFVNDNGSRDVQIDYVVIDGSTYQSEDQATNTGVWQNSSCGGSYSEWLHCNGYITYGSNSGSSSTGALGCGECDWYGTIFPICCNTTDGWGWESNMSCIGINTCINVKSSTADKSYSDISILPAEFIIYPNPAKNELYVYAKTKGFIEIFDYLGRLVYTEAMPDYQVVLDISTLKSGIYYVKHSNSIETTVNTFLKN